MQEITGYHAHAYAYAYYDANSIEQARKLCEFAKEKFAVDMGRMHEKAVGPHPMWSCQLAFAPELFGEIIPWIALHREGLTFFIHPITGDDLKDHTDHAIWMGTIEALNLSIFNAS